MWETETSEVDLRKRHSFFECFPYVCPEPVLVKWCIQCKNGAQMAFLYRDEVSHGTINVDGRAASDAKRRTCVHRKDA